jgi:16S rRNA (guanine527-N7)-methyltransferase
MSLGDEQLHTFSEYLRALYRMQDRIHLISRQDYQRIARRHVLPSLMAKPFMHGTRVGDIGSGGGFPGLPMAIVDRGLHVTLFESIGKKAEFLKECVYTLVLETIEVVHGRAESYKGGVFDTLLLRAVGTIKRNLKAIERLLAPDGRAIFYKTHRTQQELTQAALLMKRLGFNARVERLYTPLEQRPLAFVILERTAHRMQ